MADIRGVIIPVLEKEDMEDFIQEEDETITKLIEITNKKTEEILWPQK